MHHYILHCQRCQVEILKTWRLLAESPGVVGVGRAILVLKDILLMILDVCRVSTIRKSDLFLVHFNINSEEGQRSCFFFTL